MGEREHLRTTTTAGAALCLVFAVAMGCGRSLKDDHDGDGASGSSSGGNAGDVGGTSGASGDSGSSALGGSSGSGGTSAQGGSAEGGSSQGGSSGAGGEGGTPIPTRLLAQTGNALLAIDPDTAETTEVCPEATALVRYDLVDWVNERAIIFRQFMMAPTAGEILRVALDGSECTSLLLSESVLAALQPAAGNHVVVAVAPVLMSAFGAPNGDARLRRPMGLASFDLDGTELEVLAPNGLLFAQVAEERVLFQRSVDSVGYDVFSALPSTGSVTQLVPVPGSKSIDAVRGRRVVVSDRTAGTLWAVDTDGGNLVTLDAGAEVDYGAGFVGDRIIVGRNTPPSSSLAQGDLFSVDENGGELVPIASSVEHEMFRGSVGERVVYERATDLYTVRLDGTDPRRVLETAGLGEQFAAAVVDRMVFSSTGSSTSTYYSAASDGSDLVRLHDAASGFAGAVGGRVMLYIGVENYDLVSVSITGGDPFLLADGPAYDWLVGSLGAMLVIQRGDRVTEGEVLRINADGSEGVLLHASARYIGSVSEACGAVVAGRVNPPCSE